MKRPGQDNRAAQGIAEGYPKQVVEIAAPADAVGSLAEHADAQQRHVEDAGTEKLCLCATRWTESEWPQIQEALVDAMSRLENALKPALESLKL